MNIEIVEFYPIKDKKFIGTLHIYIIDYNLDVRGIKVFRMKKNYFFQMPGMTTIDENGKKVFYPYISFIDENTKKSLIDQIIKKGSKYVKSFEYTKNKENK